MSTSTERKEERSAQCLEYSECAKTKFRAENREKTVEEGCRPRNLRQKEEYELENDEETVEDRPEDACGLIRDGTTSEEWSLCQDGSVSGQCKGAVHALYVAAGLVIKTWVMLKLVHGTDI